MSRPPIIITGPTGVGKSDFALRLAAALNGSILNGDMGQQYVPLTIGTAKPDWKASPIEHLLFDTIDTPRNSSAYEYRNMVIDCVNHMVKVPIITGGTYFYVKSLFFVPESFEGVGFRAAADAPVHTSSEVGWEKLKSLDPERAAAIHPNDTFRIERALSLIATHGKMASGVRQIYKPISEKFLFINLTRNRKELYERIDRRVLEMLDDGWVKEIQGLDPAGFAPAWKEWLVRKKMIGYDNLICEMQEKQNGTLYVPSRECIEKIQQRTRKYAKRQMTFWRSLSQELGSLCSGNIVELDLTLCEVDLYLERLINLHNDLSKS